MALTFVMETAGILLVLYTLREVFRDIFHPTRSGNLSDLAGRLISRLFRTTRLRPAIGPMALVTVIVTWVLASAVGFALVYYPLFPRELSPESAAANIGQRTLHSLYMSVGALGTFQTFDVSVRNSWIRLVVGLEGLVGISLITASVSWLVLIYPALQRMRFLAKRTFVIVRAGEHGQKSRVESARLVEFMADRVIQARIDYILFPILMFFFPLDPQEGLAQAMPHLQRMAEHCLEPNCPAEMRSAALQLREALLEFSRMLTDRIVHADPEDLSQTFQAFAERGN